MHWYVAKLIFRIVSGDGDHRPQFDEQLRLVAAYDEPEALAKARALGEKDQESFLNLRGQCVCWQFVEVVELSRISGLADGSELHYQLTEPEKPDVYLRILHQKADDLVRRLADQVPPAGMVLSA